MNTERVLATAENYVGFRSRALRTNDFGAKAGHNTEIWAGSFVQVVLQEAGYEFPVHFSDTVSATAYARLRKLTDYAPKPGDIAVYGFSTDGALSQPHVGIVSDISNLSKTGTFQAIEGEVAPNSSRKHVHPSDGVWKRTRYATEATEFIRMSYWQAPKPRRKANSDVLSADFSYLGRGDHVTLVQKALGDVFRSNLWNVRKGTWDSATSHAYAQWQRFTGVKPTGLPDAVSLPLLGVETGRWVG